jgi:saccharopine dehydrogenase-like NADP-dependent oxidoreductase
MQSNRTVTVFGAYGHTGQFIILELRKRGWTPILSGRDIGKLNAFGKVHPALEVRQASVDDPASIDRALVGAAAVINRAGPFATTAAPIIDAALRARISYLDVAAEIEANVDTFEHYVNRAREAAVVIVPAMAFYGGLGDLLATVAMGDWQSADEIRIAYGLSSWKPTPGTRATGQVSRERRGGRRVVFSNHRMQFRAGAAPMAEWTFPAPLGLQAVMAEFTMADSVTIPRHLKTPEIRSYMTVSAVKDISNPDLGPPTAADDSGRSSQNFVVEVAACLAGKERRAAASGRDIYAVTAPLIVEALERIANGAVKKTGVLAAGEAFDARDFLQSLSPEHLSLNIE